MQQQVPPTPAMQRLIFFASSLQQKQATYIAVPVLHVYIINFACRSFTVGTLHSRPHHLSSSTAAAPSHHGHSSSSAFAHAASSRGGSKHVHSSGLRTHQKQQELESSAAAGAGRRSPLQQALHSKHHAAALASNGGYIGSSGGSGGSGVGLGSLGSAAAGVAGSGGSFTGGQLVPKVQQVMSESVKPETIAKGFAGGMRGRVTAAAAAAYTCFLLHYTDITQQQSERCATSSCSQSDGYNAIPDCAQWVGLLRTVGQQLNYKPPLLFEEQEVISVGGTLQPEVARHWRKVHCHEVTCSAHCCAALWRCKTEKCVLCHCCCTCRQLAKQAPPGCD
jgi:hypothetical protein